MFAPYVAGFADVLFFCWWGLFFFMKGFISAWMTFKCLPLACFFFLSCYLIVNKQKNEGDEERDEGKSRENEVALRCILYYIIEHIKHKSAMLYICIFLVVVGTGGKQKKKWTRMIGSTVPAILLRCVVLNCFFFPFTYHLSRICPFVVSRKRSISFAYSLRRKKTTRIVFFSFQNVAILPTTYSFGFSFRCFPSLSVPD